MFLVLGGEHRPPSLLLRRGVARAVGQQLLLDFGVDGLGTELTEVVHL